MRKTIGFVLSGLVAAALMWADMGAAFANVKPDFDQGVDVRQTLGDLRSGGAQTPAVAPRGVPAKEAVAEWTIMYFINGKNNLVDYVDTDMNHMEEVGSSDKLNIVVEVGKGASVKRYMMKKDDKPGDLTSPVLQDLGNADMGDWKHLAEYGKWVKANYPAKHYMLSIWNHGSGWTKSQRKFQDKGISYDDETGHHISTQDLAKALAEMGGVDIYASDACLMQMAEVSYELRDVAGLVLGSEDNEPGQGWNYARYMGPLAQNPAMSAVELGSHYIEAFRSSYQEAGLATTISAVDPKAFKELIPVLDGWTSAVMAADEKDIVRDAREKVQHFSDSDNIDLSHFVRLLNEKTASGAVKSSGESLIKYMQEKLVLGNAVTGDRHPGAAGMAIYLPQSYVSQDYAELAWAKESKWPAFVQWMVGLKKPSGAGGESASATSGARMAPASRACGDFD